MTFLGLLAVGCGKPTTTGTAKLGTSPTQRLPDISVFLDRPSDRFPVDIDDVCRGHPFMGIDADHPHAGAHAHFDNSGNRWPNGGDEPSNYPAIYAVADGVVARIDNRFHLGPGNDSYGVDLAFAQNRDGATCHFCYSIEPMVAEPRTACTSGSSWSSRSSRYGRKTASGSKAKRSVAGASSYNSRCQPE